jgi:hypothetical protein
MAGKLSNDERTKLQQAIDNKDIEVRIFPNAESLGTVAKPQAFILLDTIGVNHVPLPGREEHVVDTLALVEKLGGKSELHSAFADQLTNLVEGASHKRVSVPSSGRSYADIVAKGDGKSNFGTGKT